MMNEAARLAVQLDPPATSRHPLLRAGFLLALAPLVGSAEGRAGEPPLMPLHETPRPLPSISFVDGAGTALTLDDWRGRVVLLNVWATWCAPCRHEMPTLDRLEATLGGERFEVVALSIDRAGPGVVRAFFDEIGIEHLGLFIDETMQAPRDLGLPGLPGTILVDAEGREIARLVGPAEWDSPAMIETLSAVIAAQDTMQGAEQPSTEKEPEP